MRFSTVVAFTTLLILAGLPIAAAEEPTGPTFERMLDELLPGMGAEKIPDRRDAQQRFQGVCFRLGTPGREAERAEACKVIAGKLPEAAKPAKIFLLKQLEYIGRGECVDAVAALLDDKDAEIRECARRALQNNPAAEANVKLLAALAATRDGKWQVALANSLGYRGDLASVAALAKLLGGNDRTAAAAAANALGKIGGQGAIDALEEFGPTAPRELQVQMADAYLRCADKLLKEGNTDPAARIYREMSDEDAPRTIRLAALQGMLNAAGEKAAPMILEMLASDDADAQAIAAGQVENLLGTGAMRTSASDLSKLSTPGQILLLAALAARGDKAAMPVAVAAVKSTKQEVRLAGIRALAKLGDASVVSMLIGVISSGGNEGGAARESLRQVFGQGVDEAVISAMQNAETGMRGTLIELLDARKASAALPALLKEAEHQDGGIRSRAMRALGNIAEPKHLSQMIELLLRTEKGPQRDDAEKAIVLVCSRIPEEGKRADPLLAAVSKAGDAERCVLLSALGRIGGKKAMETVQAAVKDENAEVREAGVRALCNWPDASVADDLLELAQTAQQKSHRIWALRALIRVIALPSERPDKEKLGMLKRAMQLATRDQERNLILERAAAVREIETLRFVVPYLDREELAERACRTVVELAHHRGLREPHKAEFNAALKKVIQICKDRSLVDRANRYMQGL